MVVLIIHEARYEPVVGKYQIKRNMYQPEWYISTLTPNVVYYLNLSCTWIAVTQEPRAA